MGKPNRTLKLSLGGVELDLKFEALELMELKRLSGKSASSFISALQPMPGEEKADTILRTMDLDTVVPVIQAGLAGNEQYNSMPARKLTARICEYIDKEALAAGESVITVAGLKAMELWPVLVEALLPPGMTLEDVQRKMEAEKKGPLPEPPGETTSPGTNSWSSAPAVASIPPSSTG